MNDIPWFWPTVVVIAITGIASRRRVSQALDIGSASAVAISIAIGLIVGATLTPGRSALELGDQGRAACDFTRMGLIPVSELAAMREPALNVLLFVPLGVVLGLLRPSARTWVVIGFGAALPLVIEVAQVVALPLDRACESADVIDNLTGLFAGLCAGGLVRRLTVTEESIRGGTP